MSAQGIHYFINSLMPEVLGRIDAVDCDDLSGTESGFAYNFTEIRLANFGMDRPEVKLDPGIGIKVLLSRFTVDVSLRYSVRGTRWMSALWTSGRVRFILWQRQAAHALMALDVSPIGAPAVNLSVGDVALHVEGVHVEGSALAGIFELVSKLLKSRVEAMVAADAKVELERAVNGHLNDYLARMSFRFPLPVTERADLDLVADLSLCSVHVGQDYLAFELLGAVVDGDKSLDGSLDGSRSVPREPPPGLGSRMLVVALSTWTLDTGLRLFYEHGLLRSSIDRQRHLAAGPAGRVAEVITGAALTESCGPVDDSVAIEAAAQRAPTVQIREGEMDVDCAVKVELRVAGAPHLYPLAVFSAPLKSSALLGIARGGAGEERVRLEFRHLSATPVRLLEGDGEQLGGVNSYAERFARSTLTPLLNDLIGGGFVLREIHGLRLTSAEFALKAGAVLAAADLVIDHTRAGRALAGRPLAAAGA